MGLCINPASEGFRPIGAGDQSLTARRHYGESVTAMAVSFDLNLLFFASNEGLWILRLQWTLPPVYLYGTSTALVPNPNCAGLGHPREVATILAGSGLGFQ